MYRQKEQAKPHIRVRPNAQLQVCTGENKKHNNISIQIAPQGWHLTRTRALYQTQIAAGSTQTDNSGQDA